MKQTATYFIIIFFMALAFSGGSRSKAFLYAQDAQKIPQIQKKSSDATKPNRPDVRVLPLETPGKKGNADVPDSTNRLSVKKAHPLPHEKAYSKLEKKQTARATSEEKPLERMSIDDAVILISPSQESAHISFEGWREQMSFREIKNWARTYGLKALRPEGFNEATRASFISKHGSKVFIKNLNPLRHYYLWVQFVNYALLTETDISALLDICADRELIARLPFAKTIEKPDLFVFEIPCHLSMDGTLTLEFREYSSTGGFFGIWNIALSDSIEQPKIFSPKQNDGKMREPDTLIDNVELKGRPRIEKHGKTTELNSSTAGTIPSISPKNITPSDKSIRKDIRAQKPGTQRKKTEGKAAKTKVEKSPRTKSNTQLEQQKEAEARKMLQDDKKKDVRTQ